MPSYLLSAEQADPVLRMAARKNVRAAVTFRDVNRWLTFHGNLTSLEDGCLGFESLESSGREPSASLTAGAEVGVTFRMGPYKYSFNTVTVEAKTVRREGDQAGLALSVRAPQQMQQMDRRVYPRTAVPESRRVRAFFWPGGRAVEPSGLTPDRPTWSANVVDLSLNGFGLRTSLDAGNLLEIGDLVGAKLTFPDVAAPVYVNLQVRHVIAEGTMCLLGLQFAGMELTDEGREALDLLARKVREFEAENG